MPRAIQAVMGVVLGAPPRSVEVRKPARVMPVRLRLYVFLVTVSFGVALTAALTYIPPAADARMFVTAAGIGFLICVARVFPIRVAPKRKMLVDTAPAFAAVLLLPPALGMSAAAAGMLAGEIRTRGKWFQALFNTAVSGLRVGAAAFVYRDLAGIPLDTAAPVDLAPFALLPAAAALYLISSVLVDIAAGLTLGQNPFKDWWATQARKLPHECVLLLLGVFVALPAREDPWLLPLLIVPAAIVRWSLQDGLQVKSETREALESLAEAVDLRHQRSADHSRRVAELSRVIARRLGLPPQEVDLIVDAARLRDIGEVALSPELLARTDTLSDAERAEIRQHPVISAQMVERFPDFAACAPLIRHHHERWDGWGGPDGLTGDAIPLGSRIIAVADTYEALIASRPYREALSQTQACEEVIRCAGTQLDPLIVGVLLETLGYQPAGRRAPQPHNVAAAAPSGGFFARRGGT